MDCWNIEIVLEDITKMDIEAIVIPTLSDCTMADGIALKVKNAGGDKIEREALSKAPVRIGDAIITSAGKLPCKWVIHAPIMSYPRSHSNIKNIESAIRGAINCARIHNIKSMAMPIMGTRGIELNALARTIIGTIKYVNYMAIRYVLVAEDKYIYSSLKMFI